MDDGSAARGKDLSSFTSVDVAKAKGVSSYITLVDVDFNLHFT